MSKKEGSTLLQAGLRQLFRYGIVGLLNSSIDFVFTNMFVIATGASSAPELFLASFSACSIATINSYFINRRWTFKGSNTRLPRYALAKYFMVAMIAMLANTSTFLFIFHYLSMNFQVPRMLGINLAKLVGVGVGAVIAFLGFRISIFRPASLLHFRDTFHFSRFKPGYSFLQQSALLVLAATVVRCGYLMLTTSIFGDAVNYGWIARHIAEGNWQWVQGGWVTIFCYWEALFYLLGFNNISAAIAASMIPGILLLIPVVWLTRSLYGEGVAWIAGAVTALHPRLVEYSANGYSETFYILFFTLSIALFTASMRKSVSAWVLFASGACMGIYFVVRNEALVTVVILLLGTLAISWQAQRRKKPLKYSNSWIEHPWISTVSFLFGFGTIALLWLGLGFATTDENLLFQRSSVLIKQYSEQLDPRESAKEVYGAEGPYLTGKWPQRTWGERLLFIAQRLPRNFIQMLRAMPGILLTPLCFLALLFPVFCRNQPPRLHPGWPLLVMMVVPVLVFPPLHIEPRYFMPMLIPIHIFGSATLVALGYFVKDEMHVNYLLPALTGGILIICFGIVVWRGVELEKRYTHHRELADWIQNYVDPEESIVGGGYGFVSTTGFLADRQTINRIWTYDPGQVVSFVKDQNSEWLILYETFIRKANPELETVMEYGLPHMEKLYETRDHLDQRVQVYRMQKSTTEPIKPSNEDLKK